MIYGDLNYLSEGGPLEQVAQVLRLLGDETRLRILVLLSQHPLNVSELTSILGVAQSGVSRHLGHLRKLGLIQEQKAGIWTYYQLCGPEIGDEHLQLLWSYVHSQLGELEDPFNDQVRLQEVIRQRELGGPGLNERLLEPGQTWYAWSRLLGMLIRFHKQERVHNHGERKGLVMLDLGCGDGSLTVEMGRFAERVIGVDYNPELLASARQRMDRLGLEHIDLLAEDVVSLSLEPQSVDVAVFSQSLHHLDDPFSGIQQAFRLLRPGGLVAVMELAAHDQLWVLEKLKHKWPGFEQEHLLKMMQEAGFSNLREEILPQSRGELFQVILAIGARN